jgi:hypothetical protein
MILELMKRNVRQVVHQVCYLELQPSVTDNNSVQNLNQTTSMELKTVLNNIKTMIWAMVCCGTIFDGLRMFVKKEQLRKITVGTSNCN